MNNEGAQERLTLLSSVLASHGLEAKAVIPLEYDENCPFPYNNFTYRIDLVAPATSRSSSMASKACTTPFAEDGTSKLVFRISNTKAEGLTQTNRVQNEVAALYLARSSVVGSQASAAPSLIPAVYDWQAAGDGTAVGWILMECMPGVCLDQHFEELPDIQKRELIDQLAGVFAAVQRATLPETITGYGGLDINGNGAIVSGATTTLRGGPWPTFIDFLKNKLSGELKEADESEVLQGWHKNGVRQRIDHFLETGIFKNASEANIDTQKRVLLHSDITLSNVLFDKATNRITGLIDFDFASVGHPFQEFVDSFRDVGGNVLSGPTPETLWWQEAIRTRGIISPDRIPGNETLKLLYSLAQLLCPFRLVHPVFLKRKTADQIVQERAEAETKLVGCLESLGA